MITTTTATIVQTHPPMPMRSLPAAVGKMARDGAVITWRNLVTIRRNPGVLLGVTLQPIMFVLLFAFVFGGSFSADDPQRYREFLIGGIFAQTVAFNAAFTTLGIATDLDKGVIDRFRSLPMARSAVLLGRTTSDLLTNVFGLIIMSLCGLLIGWRIHTDLGSAMTGFAVLLLFGYAMSWLGAFIGLLAGTVEVAQSVGFMWLFPVTFLSSAFVAQTTLPGPLGIIAAWNPVTGIADATRVQFGNPPLAGFPAPEGWPAEHPTGYAVLCSLTILAIFAPLAVARYRRTRTR